MLFRPEHNDVIGMRGPRGKFIDEPHRGHAGADDEKTRAGHHAASTKRWRS